MTTTTTASPTVGASLVRTGIDPGTVLPAARQIDEARPDKRVVRGRYGTSPALTRRQGEVLMLMAQGRTNGGIAQRLSITEKAVVQHTSHIYDALGLPPNSDDHRRVLAVILFLAQA